MSEKRTIPVELIKKLREKTGAGVMDCLRALEKSNGDMEKAEQYLRLEGLSKAEKKMGRATGEGVIGYYIHHGNRLGALVEVNCESDFVARTPEFLQLAQEIAMQVAGMNPRYMSREEVPQSVIEEQKRLFYQKALNEGYDPEKAEEVANDRLERFFQEVCLLEQSCIRDDTKTVGELLKEKIALFGENVTIRRFVRLAVGSD
ncbi:MAG: translation elongation factor Ts [Armatimonadetes bacterium]|nr:translation elongation factor Ts [Armatimonadota bacterium]MDW8122049.1 translation elongation factor Ts [Armatimonadota bacterium]